MGIDAVGLLFAPSTAAAGSVCSEDAGVEMLGGAGAGGAGARLVTLVTLDFFGGIEIVGCVGFVKYAIKN